MRRPNPSTYRADQHASFGGLSAFCCRSPKVVSRGAARSLVSRRAVESDLRIAQGALQQCQVRLRCLEADVVPRAGDHNGARVRAGYGDPARDPSVLLVELTGDGDRRNLYGVEVVP